MTAATTVIVAIALSVLVPIAQLQTAVEKAACCCPDPDTCKCDHDGGDPSQTSMESCQSKTPQMQRQVLPQFVAPEIAVVDAPSRPMLAVVAPIPDPHPAPAPRRPDAPS